ncbi:MAG: M1 family aminopeptidase [Bacteroidota bacterium]
MFWELFRFELYYRRRRATTYIYFLVIFITSFLVITGPTFQVAGTADATSPNSPYTIAALMVVLSFFFTMITSSLVGVSVIRDVEHGMAPIMFTTPIHKGSYLFGRYVGSLVTLILINTGIIFGALLAYEIGKIIPRDITWRTKEVLPFDGWAYLQPFLLFIVSNIFISGSLFFAAGALARRAIVIYSQGILLMMLYQIASTFYLRDLDSQFIAALIDPFGVQTFVYMTRYWTSAEQNTQLVPLADVLLYNRLIWTSIAIIFLIITYWQFSFTSKRGFTWRKKQLVVHEETVGPVIINAPVVSKQKSVFKQLLSTTLFHFRGIWTEVPFMAIAGSGLIVLFVNASGMDNMYGTSSYPTTSAVLTMLNSFALFFMVIMIFYSGEIVWKERQHKINSITDSTPIHNGPLLLSKFLSLCLVYLTLLVGFLVFGIVLQASHGYFDFDLPAYFGKLFGESFINLCLLTIAAMLIQVLSGNKFLGFILTVAFVIIIQLLPAFGIDHELAAYTSGSLENFSQMNGFGPFVTPFVWLKAYWTSLAIVLFVAAILFYRRGSARQPLTTTSKLIGSVALLSFIACGAYIYYNTSVVNHFENNRALKVKQVRYEKELKQFEHIPQPKIVAVNLSVDLYPDRRSFSAKGSYWLKNQDTVPINIIQVQHMSSPQLHLHDIDFGRQSKAIEQHDDLGYHAYEISTALAPGDSLRMNFAMEFTQTGFRSKPQNTDLAYNGTFIHSNYFPSIGYDSQFELTTDDDRRRFALNPRNEKLNTPRSEVNLYSKDADRVRFSMIVSTDVSQTPLAPGRMEKSWTENNRQYRQYTTTGTIPSFYAILSGNYKVASDKWNDVDLEIYYHPQHHFNIDRMMQGLKDGLDYYTKNFGAFPDSQIRIAEFPRYSTMAQSFPDMIAFSEGVGFILKVSEPTKDLDVPYYVTAHELAHQWWGQHVMAADTAGNAMITEGASQYSALMVMNHTFPVETMQLFLKYELDSYLKGRSAEKMREVPLQSASNQQYISYNKSALVFFALQDYIGENNLNTALKRFHTKFAYKKPPYPTSNDLINEIRKVTPDSLSYLISDMFEHITLYENQATEAAYRKVTSGKYEVTVNLSTQKLQVDANGHEVPVAINDWIDVGVYGEGENGKLKLIYLQKHKFTRQKNTLTITVNSEPIKVGIDPLNKLIDHHSTDNTIATGTIVELANSPLGY